MSDVSGAIGPCNARANICGRRKNKCDYGLDKVKAEKTHDTFVYFCKAISKSAGRCVVEEMEAEAVGADGVEAEALAEETARPPSSTMR